jgi:acetyltransferase-like isoleucine patch superfamily enzyme
MERIKKIFTLCRLIINDYGIYLNDGKDLLHSPWEFKAYGKEVTIRPPTIISYKEDIILQDRVRIQDGCHIVAKGGLFIGKNTTISSRCMIFTVTPKVYEGWPAIRDVGYDERPINIGKNVFVGAGSCLCPGVNIGEGAIIGMGSVVSGNIPRLAVAAGNPAKVIKYRDEIFYMEHMANA